MNAHTFQNSKFQKHKKDQILHNTLDESTITPILKPEKNSKKITGKNIIFLLVEWRGTKGIVQHIEPLSYMQLTQASHNCSNEWSKQDDLHSGVYMM